MHSKLFNMLTAAFCLLFITSVTCKCATRKQVHLLLLVDLSGSITYLVDSEINTFVEGFFEDIRKRSSKNDWLDIDLAAAGFRRLDDRFSLEIFDFGPKNMTKAEQLVKEAYNNANADATTSMANGLKLAYEMINRSSLPNSTTKIVLMVSDGCGNEKLDGGDFVFYPTIQSRPIKDAIVQAKKLKRAGVTVISILVGQSSECKRIMTRLAYNESYAFTVDSFSDISHLLPQAYSFRCYEVIQSVNGTDYGSSPFKQEQLLSIIVTATVLGVFFVALVVMAAVLWWKKQTAAVGATSGHPRTPPRAYGAIRKPVPGTRSPAAMSHPRKTNVAKKDHRRSGHSTRFQEMSSLDKAKRETIPSFHRS